MVEKLARKQVNYLRQQTTRKSLVVLLRVLIWVPHKLNLMHALSSVEGVRNCGSSMDENLIRIGEATKRRILRRTVDS